MDSVEHIVKLKEIAKDYTILFVEDSQALQKQIVKFLSKFFKKVHVASDGQEGLILYEKVKPDLVLTDLTMPIMSGHDMIREIKKINPDVEIVILSAHSDSETLMKSFHIGVSDFIAKPVNAPKMIGVFLKVLSNIKRKEYQLIELAGQVGSNSLPKVEDSEILSFLFESSMKIDIINHYRGVPIINSGKIISINDEEITLRTTHFQLLAIKEQEGAILDSSLVSEDIDCSLVSMNIDEYEVTLKKQKLFYPEFKDRNEIIIEADHKTKAYIINDEKHRVEVKLEGISSKELFINVDKDNFYFEKHDLIYIMIVLSNDENDNPIEYLKLTSRVYKKENKENNSLDVILLNNESDEVENSLQKYIYKREAELIEEFKNKFQYS